MSMWALSNNLVSSGHDLYQRYEELAAQGADLAANRWMRFIADNAARSLHDGWQLSLDGLLVQTLGMVEEVGAATAGVALVMYMLACCSLHSVSCLYVPCAAGRGPRLPGTSRQDMFSDRQ
jgi:hypothetical protein